MFITFEGVDGSGKTTQIDQASAYFQQQNHRILRTKEPGGTVVGQKLRSLLLNTDHSLDATTELFLYLADRVEHVKTVIQPALAGGEIVFSDRYQNATIAYQQGGRQLCLKDYESVFAHFPQPDLTFWFDLSLEEMNKRITDRGEAKNRMEQEKEDFFSRVIASYREQWQQNRSRILRIDASADRDTIALEVRHHIQALLREHNKA